jgi:hypothetical protein
VLECYRANSGVAPECNNLAYNCVILHTLHLITLNCYPCFQGSPGAVGRSVSAAGLNTPQCPPPSPGRVILMDDERGLLEHGGSSVAGPKLVEAGGNSAGGSARSLAALQRQSLWNYVSKSLRKGGRTSRSSQDSSDGSTTRDTGDMEEGGVSAALGWQKQKQKSWRRWVGGGVAMHQAGQAVF